MQNPIKPLITLFATGLFLWLLWGFWSLGQTVSIFITVLVLILTCGGLLWRYKQQSLTTEKYTIEALPSDDYRGAVVLVCGQSQALFPDGINHRETAQGWYIHVATPAELIHLVETLAEHTPSLLEQLSVLFAVLPEQITQQEVLTQTMLNWRRAMGESRQKAGKNLPLWITIYLSAPNKLSVLNKLSTPNKQSTELITDNEAGPWLTLLSHQREFQVEREGVVAEPLSLWLSSHGSNAEQQLQTALWFDLLLDWLHQIFTPQLTAAQTGTPILTPSAWAVQWIAVDSQPNNIWQQFIQEKTTLPLIDSIQSVDLLPLPDVMLRRLHHDTSLSRSERLVGIIGLICGIFLVGALSGSYQHNRQLIRHTGEDATRFQQLPELPLTPKLTAYQQLQNDAAQLARWEREGIPTAYSLALYQGEHLLPYLHMVLASWSPPTLPEPSAPTIVQAAPEMVSLDSLALFDVGQYTLKTSATKVLVDALINIRAKPGWLIVVSGYTDNTGSAELNQKLSLKRAESVRDWMIETSDINPTCFAVQGYGHNHPIADNDTQKGRASNRRVEIRLMPQADACQASNTQTVPSTEDGTHSTVKEK